MKKGLLFICLWLVSCSLSHAQDSGYVMCNIHLDSFVVTASKYGFDVAGFIKRVENDTTFYKAFKNLRILSYIQQNDIRIYNNNSKEKLKASLKSRTWQHRKDSCRTMEVIDEKTTGSFYKRNGDYNYYTAELYADLFFAKGSVCGETNLISKPDASNHAGGAIERHKEQLKQLIFNPGQPVRGIPFIGGKVAIFDEKIAPMYNFAISSAAHDTTGCYVFTATAKPEYTGKVVIHKLVTYFSKKNMEIVYRDYALSYNTILFNFDVEMRVNMTHFDGLMVPRKIEYKGNWKVLFKKREPAVFITTFSQFSHQG